MIQNDTFFFLNIGYVLSLLNSEPIFNNDDEINSSEFKSFQKEHLKYHGQYICLKTNPNINSWKLMEICWKYCLFCA